MFNWAKTQNPIANLKEHLRFELVIIWRQRLYNFMDGESLNGIGRSGVLIPQEAYQQKTSHGRSVDLKFPEAIILTTSPNVLDNDAIVLKTLARLGMIFIVLNLFPTDACRRNEITFKIFIRDATMFSQKAIDRLGKILVGFPNCWIESKQPHRQILTNPSEMSLYQLKRHFSDRKVIQSVRSCVVTTVTSMRRVVTSSLWRNWRTMYECS